MDEKTFEALRTAGQLLAENVYGHPKGQPIEMRICVPKKPCPDCLTIYPIQSEDDPCPNCAEGKNE